MLHFYASSFQNVGYLNRAGVHVPPVCRIEVNGRMLLEGSR